MTESTNHGKRPGGAGGERPNMREANARMEAAVQELGAAAREQAIQHLEHMAARLRAQAERENAAAFDATTRMAPPHHQRQPLWLWSNKPRSRKLYRTPRSGGEGKVCGVCAGIANLYGLEPFVVRLALVALCLATQGVALVAYVAAAFIMDTEPAAEAAARRAGHEFADNQPHAETKPKRGFASRLQHVAAVAADAYAPPAPPTLPALLARFAELEQRLRRIEHFVTSEHYDLHREFAKIGA